MAPAALTAAVVLVTGLHYHHHARGALNGPSGGSPEGIAYGTAALLAILVALLLWVRRKVPTWRVGSGRWWLRTHIWIGLLPVPLVAFHCGFRAGGFLTTLNLVLLIAVVGSGLLGLLLQQFLPGKMLASVPRETVYEEAGRILNGLESEAERLLESARRELAAAEETGDEIDPVAVLEEFHRVSIRPRLAGEVVGVRSGGHGWRTRFGRRWCGCRSGPIHG